MIFTIVNVCSTPISFYTVEKFGRRPLLVWGAFGMLVCQFLVAIIGVTVGFNKTVPGPNGDPVATNISAVNAQVAFIAVRRDAPPACPSRAHALLTQQIFIFFFGSFPDRLARTPQTADIHSPCAATTWGPGAWVLIGEIFPLPIRSRGVALSTAS